MPWTRTADGFVRTFTVPDGVTYNGAVLSLRRAADAPIEWQADGSYDAAARTVTFTVPLPVARQVKANGGAFVQIDVFAPDGGRHTVYGHDVTVPADESDIVRYQPPHPRAALRQAIVDASTVAAVKAALLAYLDALDRQ